MREFDGDVDHATTIASFLGHAQDLTGQTVGWHPGEFVWNAYRPSSPTRFATIEQRGQIIGFTYFRQPGEFECVLEPALRAAGGDIDLAEEIVRQALSWPSPDGLVSITVAEQDGWMADIVGAQGFVNSHRAEFRNSWLPLTDPLPVVLPAGFRVVTMDAGANLEERVELHRDVWAPTRFNMTDYEKVRESNEYRSALDMAAVAADGTYASYATGWFDPVSRIGQLEPVGTQAQFRGLGLGKAVIATILNRMLVEGAIGCWVLSEDDNAASNALYQSVGFRQTTRLEIWTREG
ncbi:MAG TPA: GNAT family N-acetyltransferase [Thermomicrobiales bacterium]|nr:GNAT family N-acetyltransferase [Thermomicrobiales bacterium]